MAIEIVVPSIAESISTGVISKWHKPDGAAVKRDEELLDLETDKVTMPILAPADGVVRHAAKAGDTVNVGQVIGAIEAGGAAGAKAEPAKVEAKGAPTAAKTASAAPTAGATVGAGAGAAVAASAAAPALGGNAAAGGGAADVVATPLAKKLAAEHGVDLSKVVPTGAGQRVREQDVLPFVQARTNGGGIAGGMGGGVGSGQAGGTNGAARPVVAAGAPGVAAAGTVGASGGGVTREKMTPLRQRIAQRLVQAQHTAAMLTTFNEVDMSAVMELRKAYKDEFEKRHGIGLGFMGFFVKAVVQGLRAFPLVNASIVEEQGQLFIERHESCDVAVAVSTPKGLVVPVVRGCEKLSMAAIESKIKDLAVRGRDGKLSLDEMQGGTFTITNGGVFGSLMSTPILNPPQSAILGMHAIKARAVEYPAGSGQVAIRPMMYLAVSYDHRIIDGAEAVQFLVKIKQGIEDPQRLLLEV